MTKDALEIGGRAIYEFRAHPRRAPWDSAAAETRASYRARMQELVNALNSAGYSIQAGTSKPKLAAVRGESVARARRR